MRSQLLQPASSQQAVMNACHSIRCRPPLPNILSTHHTQSSRGSSSTPARSGSSRCSALERERGCIRCRAAGFSEASEPGPQQQPPAQGSQGSRSSTWGSSWGKRSSSGGGSVFKKQQAKKGPEQQGSPAEDKQTPNTAAAAGAQSAEEALDPQLEASIRINVERANQTLQEIVQEVFGELLVDEASAYVLGEEQQQQQEEAGALQLHQAVRGAVVKRLEWLDSNFLAAVNAFLTVPGVRDNPELADLLGAIRTETLTLVSARLPAPVQVLNAALGHSRRSGRAGVVSAALGGGAGDVPGTSLDALGAAATQLIDDMEDQQVVADRVLLARLVLLHEELRALAERQSAQAFWGAPEGAGTPAAEAAGAAAGADGGVGMGADSIGSSSSSSQPFFAFHRSNLPARCAAFLKNLLGVADRNKRLGLLTKTFQEDWIAESPQAAGTAATASSSQQPPQQPTFSQQRAATRDTNFGPGTHQQQQQEAPDIVRPGRLLITLHAMRQELEVQLVSAGVDSPAAGEALDLLRRLDAIRVEALLALDRVQASRPGGSSSNGGSNSSSGSALDYEVELEEHDAALQGVD